MLRLIKFMFNTKKMYIIWLKICFDFVFPHLIWDSICFVFNFGFGIQFKNLWFSKFHAYMQALSYGLSEALSFLCI